MAFHLSILLILAGLTGIHGVTTVHKVSVRAGDSISIPCLYEQRYLKTVKYLCVGYAWASCSYAIKTSPDKQAQSSEKYSISDDRNQRIFTVTIKRLAKTDDYFWCNVEINRGADDGAFFELSVIDRGTPSLTVNKQEITGFIGGNITIKCTYTTTGENRWCRLDKNCVTGSSGSIGGTNVAIDVGFSGFFMVTMSGLRLESSGWYWCAKGDFEMPVHVTVSENPITTMPTTVITTVEGGQLSASVDLKSFIIPLSLLILVVVVASLVWLKLRRKQTKAPSSGTTVADEEVTYSEIKHKRTTSVQAEEGVIDSNPRFIRIKSAQRSVVENDEDVTYSSVVIAKQKTAKRRAESRAEDTTYSTLAEHQHN